MEATLEDALALAALAHKGQKDKAGAPYILHPLRVMLSLGPRANEEERIVAVLHDVVEDCGLTLGDLARAGYSAQVLEALDGVTGREGEEYMEFMARLKPNPIARRVKLADLADNMDRSRIADFGPRDEARMEKYARARAFLEAE